MYVVFPFMHETRERSPRAPDRATQSTHDMLRARRVGRPRHRSTAGQDCPSLPRRGVPARTKRFVTFQTCTGAKIATVFRYNESREATHYHILPAAENSMLPALTAPIWSQQNGGYITTFLFSKESAEVTENPSKLPSKCSSNIGRRDCSDFKNCQPCMSACW